VTVAEKLRSGRTQLLRRASPVGTRSEIAGI